MEIFNIHIGEFLMIAALALVVFGPERLPEVGRFAGRQVAKLLAWQQQSPEIQMLNDVRAEFEQEIASLRDELVRTRKQLDVSQDMANLRDELRPMLNLRGAAEPATPAPDPAAAPAPTIAGDGGLEPLADAAARAPTPPAAPPQTIPAGVRPNKLLATEPTSALNPLPQVAPITELPPPPRHRQGLHDMITLDAPPPPPIDGVDPSAAPPGASSADAQQEQLGRLQTLMGDLQALVGELRRRDLLGADWQLPSQEGDPHPLVHRQTAEVGQEVA